jgi:hypothetical protein
MGSDKRQQHTRVHDCAIYCSTLQLAASMSGSAATVTRRRTTVRDWARFGVALEEPVEEHRSNDTQQIDNKRYPEDNLLPRLLVNVLQHGNADQQPCTNNTLNSLRTVSAHICVPTS